MPNGRAGRLHPAVGTARRHLAAALEKLLGAGSIKATGRSRTASTPDTADLPLLLVACSGGPDSLALVAIAAHFARRGDVRVGAIIVDHGLQENSAAVAAQTAQTLTDLGLHPVITEKVQVPAGNMGPERAARTARYSAFTQAVEATGARAVLLGHTLDDQAETVLLGLSRGSGTRSLAGMPPVRVAPTCSTSATLKPSPPGSTQPTPTKPACVPASATACCPTWRSTLAGTSPAPWHAPPP